MNKVLTLVLHDAREAHPDRSMNVLSMTHYEYSGNVWQTVHYSKNFDAFNAYDSQDAADNAFEIDLWAELPDDFATENIPAPDAEPDPVARMRQYSIDAPEEPDYSAYPVGE